MMVKSFIRTYGWLLAVVSAAVIYAVVLRPHGLEIQHDSCSYIRGALSLQQGLGFTYAGQYISHFTPGLSIIYAGLSSLFHVSIIKVALWCNIVWILLLGLLLKQLFDLLRIDAPLQVLGLLLYLFSTPVRNISTKLLTELPTLIVLTAASLLLFRYVKNNQRKTHLLGIGFLFFFGILLRFAMMGFLAGFLLVVFQQGQLNWRTRLLDCFYLATPPAIGVLLYDLYVRAQYHQASQDRMMVWHPISLQKIYFFVRTPFSWFFDIDYTANQTLYVLFGMGFVLLISLMANSKSGESLRIRCRKFFALQASIYWAMLTLICVYIAFLIVSITLFDASTPIDTRILSPLSIYIYLFLIAFFNHIYLNAQYKWLAQWSILGLVGVFNWSSIQGLPYRYRTPIGYNTPYWQQDMKAIICDSQEIWLRQHRTIYSNGYFFWRYLDGRAAYKIPPLQNPYTQIKNTRLHEDMLAIQNEIANDRAQLVYFNALKKNNNLIQKTDLLNYFTDSNRFDFVPFNNGFIIQGKKD